MYTNKVILVEGVVQNVFLLNNRWRRPSVINESAVYFNPSSKKQGIVQGDTLL